MSVPWIDLPDEIWEKILGYLNVRSLLKASETCSKLYDVMGKSKQLMKMIKLNIVVPETFLKGFQGEQTKLKYHRQIKELKENLQKSGRNYQNSGLTVCFFSRRCSVPLDTIPLDTIPLDTIMTNILMEICEILQLFSECIVDFKISDCVIENKVFTKIIRILTNLQTLVIDNSEIKGDDSDLSLKLPKVKHFAIHTSEGLMIKNVSLSFDNLIQLEIAEYSPFYYGLFEEFYNNLLLRQNHLKVLNVESRVIFGRNALANTESSLESLSLKCEQWTNMDHAENFFKKQTQLKVISLELNENDDGLNFRYNDILKDIFNLNQNLTEISIELFFAVEDVTFLNGICKPKVKSLSFESSEVNNDLFAALVKMCPKVKKLSFRSYHTLVDIDLVAINTLAELESLEIQTGKESMQDLLVCSESFINLTIINNNQDDEISVFLSKHQSIEHLFIDFLPISHRLCKNIVNYLPNLRSFVFDELEVPTETLKLLVTLKNLRCLKTQSIGWMNQEAKEICTSAGIEIELIKQVYDFRKYI